MSATDDRIPNLALIAYNLKKKFAFLCIELKKVIKASNVCLEDARYFISLLLDNKLEMFRESLQKVTNFDEFFTFLHVHHFAGYLNYDVLKAIAELAKDEDINKKFDDYEKECMKFLQDTSFSEVLSIFRQYPDLKPATVIGLPQAVFHLNSQQWSLKKVCDWIISFGGICGSSAYQIDDITESSIIITYTVFPMAFADVLIDLRDPVILNKFKDIGVEVQLPDSFTDYLTEGINRIHVSIVRNNIDYVVSCAVIMYIIENQLIYNNFFPNWIRSC